MKDCTENEINITIKDCDEHTKNRYDLLALRVYKFLCHERNGDFDQRDTLFVEDTNGKTYEITRTVKELNNEWVEISNEEFEENKKSRVD